MTRTMTRSLTARTSSLLAHPVAMLMVILGLAAIWLSAALETWPLLGADEAIDASVAWSLLNRGLLGSPLYPGQFKLDEAFAIYPPLSGLATVVPVALWGMGIVQARIAPVVFGALTIGGVYLLGREQHNNKVGVLAAFLTLANPLFFVTARTLRPEVFVAALMVFSLLLLARARNRRGPWLSFAAGLVGGLAVLAQTYALLGIIALLAIVVWEGRGRKPGAPRLQAFIAGCTLALLPSVAWAGTNWDAYWQQAGNLGLLSGAFWLGNIVGETQRYAHWQLTLPALPLGIAATAYAFRQFERHRLILLPVMTFLTGFWLLIPDKSFHYLGVVVPLMNILLAQALDEAAKGWAWLRAAWSGGGVVALVALVATIQLGMISWRLITWGRSAVNYRAFMAPINQVLLDSDTKPVIGNPLYWLGIDDKLRGSYIANQMPFPGSSPTNLLVLQLPAVKDRAIILMDDNWLSQLNGQPELITRPDRRSPPVGALFPLAQMTDPFFAAAGANAGQWRTLRILAWWGY